MAVLCIYILTQNRHLLCSSLFLPLATEGDVPILDCDEHYPVDYEGYVLESRYLNHVKHISNDGYTQREQTGIKSLLLVVVWA